MEEAIKRFYEVSIYHVEDLTRKQHSKVFCKQVKNIDITKKTILVCLRKVKKFGSFDVVLIRQDPPFNMKYITATYL